jgi:superfamily II DNA helicase RecQ
MQVKHFYIRLNKEHLHEDEARLNEFMQQTTVKKTVQELVNMNSVAFWSILVYFEKNETKPAKPKFDASTLPAEAKHRYELLRKWRADKASQEGVMQFVLFHNSQLAQIATDYPTTLQGIATIKGVGTIKANKYGTEILAVLNC